MTITNYIYKIVAVDVDDVIAELVKLWLRLSNRDNDENVCEKDIKTWAINKYVKCGERIYDYLKNPSLYDSVLPVDGALWGVKSLEELGFRVVFVTASTPEQSGRKYKWLMDYGFISSRKNYVEALDKSLIFCDYLLDDNPENVINSRGRGIVYTREWNKELDGYPRVDNWEDVVRYFIKIKNMGV